MNNPRFSPGTALAALLFIFFFTGLRAQDTLIHYTETTGFDHNTRNESLGLFQQIADEHGLVIVSDNDGSRFNKTDLGQARAVIFSNTSGNQGLNADQQAALEWFVDTLGRHLLGIHAASDTYRHSSANGGGTGAWDWYAETMGGSVQTSPNHTSQNHVDTIYLIQPHPSVANIAFPWVKEEEYYYWENGYLNGDIESIIEVGQTGSNSYDQQRPVAWFRTNAAGARIFYTSLGHKKSNFTGGFPAFEQLIEDAVLWLLDACQPTSSTLNASICDDENYPFDGQSLTQAGTYFAVFQNAAGCDSTVILNLDVLPTFSTSISASVCQGDSYSFDGQDLTAGGTYEATFQAANDCDSTVTLNLTVLPDVSTSLDATVCEGGSFPFDGQDLNAGGTYNATFSAANGCDSTVTLNLTVLPDVSTSLNASVCDGESFPFDGQDLNEGGTYTATFSAANGCDSTVTLNLTVLPDVSTSLDASICQGDIYSFDGQDLTAGGTYEATFQAANGCDSTVTLNLTVLPDVSTSLDATVCEGESFPFDGQDLNESGTYTATFSAANGCDSTVTLDLTVLPDVSTSLDATVCDGESFPFDGQDLNAGGTYNATFSAANGCDSTVTLNLTVLPDISTSLNASICQGDTYSFDGQDLTAGGTYEATFQAANGCDSTVTLNLTVLPDVSTSLNASVCQGDSYSFDGQDLNESGTYTATFSAANGCDSTVTLDLTVLPDVSTSLDATICDGESFPFDGQDLNEGGTYTATFTTVNGCDSTVNLDLTVLPDVSTSLDATVCDGESFPFDGQELEQSGNYTATFTNVNGCDSTVNLDLDVLTIDTAVTQSGQTLTAADADAAYQWLDCDNGLAPIAGATEASFTPAVNGNYAVQITTPEGCTGISACYEVIITNTGEATPRPFRLFPNPVGDRLTLDLAGATGSATIGLYTLQGRQLSQEIKPVAGPASLDVSRLPGGVYLLRIRIGARSQTLKFIKK